MKRSFLLLLFVTSLLPHLFGQIKEVSPGYILPLDGDTLHGFIKVRNDIANTQKCLFSQTANGKFTEYTPTEIQEYKIEGGKYYIAKKFKLKDQEMHMFVEFLVNGIVNLYYFRMPDKERYLIEKEGEPLTVIEGEVVETIYLNKDKNVSQQVKYHKGLETKTTAKFASKSKSQGLLAYLMHEDPNIEQKLQTLHFDQRSMIRLTKNYHNKVCDDYECIIYNKETNLSKKSIGIFVGGNIGSPVFKTEDSHYKSLVDVEITRQVKPVFGFNFSTTIPYVSTRLCINSYLSYSSHYFEYYHNGNSETLSTYSYQQIAITGQLGYFIINEKKFTLSPSAGISGYMLYDYKDDREIIGGYDIGPYKVLRSKKKFLISTNLGVHASYDLNENYVLKPTILYEFTRDMDDMSALSYGHVFYFMIGVNKRLNVGE